MLVEGDAQRIPPYAQPGVSRVLDAHLGVISAGRFTLLQVMHMNLRPHQEELGTGVVRDIN